MSYDPQSNDAMFSRIEAKLCEIADRAERIEAQVLKTNGRVSALEKWRDIVTAKNAAYAAAVSVAVSMAVGAAQFLLKS